MLRVVAFLTLSLLVLVSTSSIGHAQRTSAAPAQTATEGPKLKVLAEGAVSSITRPFLAVLRDSETYGELAKLDRNLPKLDPDFFKSNIVVAAFLGERNTGGYSVEIKREALGSFLDMARDVKSNLRIIEQTPAWGAMAPQMITSPFKVVALEVNPTTNLLLTPDNPWHQTNRPYRVTAGTFTMAGGFAGTNDQFGLGGYLWIMRERNLATFFFTVVGLHPDKAARSPADIVVHIGGKPASSLMDFATGVVNTDGQVKINMMSADSFVNPPNSGLKASGNLSAAGDKISLSFNSLPSMIADGYTGAGMIEATFDDSAYKPYKLDP
jgi:hypothetical protein